MAENNKNSDVLIVVGGTIALIVLGVGGYFLFLYLFKHPPATVAAPGASASSSNNEPSSPQDNSANDNYFGAGEYSYGQEYTMPMPNNLLNSSNIAACYPPGAVTASSVGPTSVVISWSPAYGASYYNVQYVPINGGTPITIPVTGTSTILQGLIPNTVYECEVQAVCSSGVSNFVSTSFITTAATTYSGLNLMPATSSALAQLAAQGAFLGSFPAGTPLPATGTNGQTIMIGGVRYGYMVNGQSTNPFGVGGAIYGGRTGWSPILL